MTLSSPPPPLGSFSVNESKSRALFSGEEGGVSYESVVRGFFFCSSPSSPRFSILWRPAIQDAVFSNRGHEFDFLPLLVLLSELKETLSPKGRLSHSAHDLFHFLLFSLRFPLSRSDSDFSRKWPSHLDSFF